MNQSSPKAKLLTVAVFLVSFLLLSGIFANWDDIKAGFRDGYRDGGLAGK